MVIAEMKRAGEEANIKLLLALHWLNPMGQSKLQGRAQSQGAGQAHHPPSGHGKNVKISFYWRLVAQSYLTLLRYYGL